MTHAETDPDLAFTPVERAFIRDELDQVFSTLPTVAEGIWLRTLMGGPRAGQPRVPSRAQGLLEMFGAVATNPLVDIIPVNRWKFGKRYQHARDRSKPGVDDSRRIRLRHRE